MHCSHNVFIFKDSLPGVAYFVLWCCLEPLPAIKPYFSRCHANAIGRQHFSQHTTSEFISSCARMHLQDLTLENEKWLILALPLRLGEWNKKACPLKQWRLLQNTAGVQQERVLDRTSQRRTQREVGAMQSPGLATPARCYASLSPWLCVTHSCWSHVWMCPACFKWWLHPFHNFLKKTGVSLHVKRTVCVSD